MAENSKIEWTTPEQMREAAIATARAYAGRNAERTINAIRAIPIAPQPVAVTVKPIEAAPRDGTMLWLLVDYSGDGGNPLEDAMQAWTIGFNNLANTDVNEWQFAGWSWEQDCFTQGYGEVIGWHPIDVHLDHSTIQPADPMSDPRVVALVEAANDAKIILATHEPHPLPVLGRMLAALRAIGGEA